MAKKTNSITVNNTQISVLLNPGDADYLSLTDMTRSFEDGNKLIEKWLNNKSTIDYIGFWESINNPNFKTPEFGGIRMEAGTLNFIIDDHFREVTKMVELGSGAVRDVKDYMLTHYCSYILER